VVSFKVVSDFWDMLGVKPGKREVLVSSAGDPSRLLRHFEDGPRIDPTLSHGVLPSPDWPQPAGTRLDPTPVIAELLTTSHRTFDVSRRIVTEDADLDAVMLYIGEFDVATHALWPYRFPQDYPAGSVSPADIDTLGPVFDRFVVDLDTHVGELASSFRTPPNIVIVSDHGAGPSNVATVWPGWHAPDGMFLAAGPDIPRNPAPRRVTYLDVVPTILDLMGFAKPSDLPGRSVVRPSN
jgi:predicted AlkP superfamily phosphohydrolase/phosphomutase